MYPLRPARLIPVLIACLLVVQARFIGFSAPERTRTRQKAVRYIRRIKVRVMDLFPDGKGFLKTMMNKLHINTREEIIHKQLLYREGQRLDMKLIEESERNLRGYSSFLVRKTRIEPTENPRYVDVIVTIQDIWSLYFNFKLEGAGGQEEYDLRLGDRNFLGLNTALEFVYLRNTFKETWRQSYSDTLLFGSRWRFYEESALYRGTDGTLLGESVRTVVEYPLFSRRTPWGFRVEALYERNMTFESEGNELKLFEPATNVALPRKYTYRRYLLSAKLTRSLGYEVKRNFSLTLSTEQKRYGVYEGFPQEYEQAFRDAIIPSDLERSKLTLGFSLNNHRFIRLRNFIYYGRIEDYSIGLQIDATLGLSQTWWGSDENAVYPALSVQHSFYEWKNHLFVLGASCSTSLSRSWQRDFVFTFGYKHYVRRLPLGFLAFRTYLSIGEKLEEGSQFTLGGSNGLRGYTANRFEGNRKFYSNLEYRFDPISIDFIQFGFVVFYDMGAAWYNERLPLHRVQLFHALGMGLRLSLPQLNPNIYRFDLGYNFGMDSTHFYDMLSFGYNQAF